jgi:hypothetical protein
MADGTTKVLIPETFQGGSSFDIAGQIGLIWELIKAPLIVPLLRLGVYVSLAMALMLFIERVYMGVVIVLVKMFWKKPEKRYNYEPLQEDLESGGSNFPVVLVQIPMFNEREVMIMIMLIAWLLITIIALCLSLWTIVNFWACGNVKSLNSWFCVFRSTRSPLELHVGSRGRPIVS